jgi:DNA-binding NtrC family response regulator
MLWPHLQKPRSECQGIAEGDGMKRLTTEEREFLARVGRSAFANPFSEERGQADRELSGLAAGASPERHLEAALGRVRGFLAKLKGDGRERVDAQAVEDERAALGVAHLFDVFHLYLDRFDELIRRQIRTEDGSCAAPFAAEALRELAARGLAEGEAPRYFAMFYQLRRAFYFISVALVGSSPCMRRLRRQLWNNVFTRDVRLYERMLWSRMEDFSTLLLGETGTGKGAAAAAIGRSGFIPFDPKRQCFTDSFMRCFLAINLSQFPETLIESELFGHRKGAFTGAVEAHEGILARCSPHGAIFLDEIGDVAIPVQIKLLQVLQEREFSPVGGHEKRRFQGRVIAATHRALDELRQRGAFRDDFFYRLCSDVITVPPLRQRLEEEPAELAELVGVVVGRIAGEPSPALTDLVLRVIRTDLGERYPWPGNVRELEQCVRRALLTHSYKGDARSAAPDARAAALRGMDEGSLTARELLTAYCRLLHARYGTYEEVARRTQLDRRTVKKYVQAPASVS